MNVEPKVKRESIKEELHNFSKLSLTSEEESDEDSVSDSDAVIKRKSSTLLLGKPTENVPE